MKIWTRNNKIAINNSMVSKKGCWKHLERCLGWVWKKNLSKKGHQGTLKAPDTMFEDTKGVKKYVRMWGHYPIKNILYFILFWIMRGIRAFGKQIGRMLGEHLKHPIFFVYGTTRDTKKDIKNGKGAQGGCPWTLRL